MIDRDGDIVFRHAAASSASKGRVLGAEAVVVLVQPMARLMSALPLAGRIFVSGSLASDPAYLGLRVAALSRASVAAQIEKLQIESCTDRSCTDRKLHR